MVQYQKPGVVKILHQDWKLIQKHHLTTLSAEKNADGKKKSSIFKIHSTLSVQDFFLLFLLTKCMERKCMIYEAD